MTIEFKDLGNIESFYENMQEPNGYGAFDEDQNPEQSFKEIIELCSCYYPVNTYMHTGSKICGNCKKLIPCYK